MLWTWNQTKNVTTALSVGVRSIVINVSVCMFACLFVCLSVRLQV